VTSDGDTSGQDHDEIPYERAREELIEVVRRLETGGLTLEESLALWERGEKLANICEEWLDGARARLDRRRAEVVDASEDAGELDE
jgi:exodeoxyribonuclease VII small subunit